MARLTIVLGTALAICVFSSGAAASRTRASTLELRVLGDLNALREAKGLAPLRVQPDLVRAAEAHSLEMVSVGYFGHDSADGTPFQSRIASFYPRRVRGAGWRAAENLAWRTGSPTAPSLITAWLASPVHRANLLAAGFRDVGISAARSERAPGVYGGRTVTVTVDFGTR